MALNRQSMKHLGPRLMELVQQHVDDKSATMLENDMELMNMPEKYKVFETAIKHNLYVKTLGALAITSGPFGFTLQKELINASSLDIEQYNCDDSNLISLGILPNIEAVIMCQVPMWMVSISYPHTFLTQAKAKFSTQQQQQQSNITQKTRRLYIIQVSLFLFRYVMDHGKILMEPEDRQSIMKAIDESDLSLMMEFGSEE
jgi:hypothetical protein